MSETPVSPTPTPAAPPRRLGRKIVIVVLIALAGLAGVIAIQPDTFKVARATTVNTPAKTVFELVNDFHHWEHWSPWAKLDPNAKNTFEGPESGKGAIFSWDGNNEIGAGRMTVLESLPHEKIVIQLEFFRPMADTAQVVFTFSPDGDKTKVDWTMSGEQNFMEKAFCMMMDLDAILGADFEKGLASLKARAEQAAP